MVIILQAKTAQKTDKLRFSALIRFYLPLTLTSILTLTTHSLFNAGLARLPSPEVYISAFAVAKSFMHVLESPIMMVRQTVSALVDDFQSYQRVRGFIIGLVGLIVLVFTFLVLSGTAKWIIRHAMGLSGETLAATNIILHVFIIFPVAAAVRNFLQGLLIKCQATPLLTAATVFRIVYVSILVVSVPRLSFIHPGILAGLLFLTAISIELVFLFVGARFVIGHFGQWFMVNNVGAKQGQSEVTSATIMRFFVPLIVTAFIKTLAMPIINMGLARTERPELALATYAVAWGLGMIVVSPLMMFHQVPLNFIDEGDPHTLWIVRRFAIFLGLGLSGAFLLLSFTNLGYTILTSVIGASEQMGILAMDVLKLMALLPLLMVSREFYWGLLMKRRMTKHLGAGKMVNVVTLTITILTVAIVGPSNPAITGIIGMIVAELCEVLYLGWSAFQPDA